MKHQQVIVDYGNMIKTSLTYLALVVSVFVFLRMTYAIFTLPRTLRRSQEQLQANLLIVEERLKQRKAKRAEEQGITEGQEETQMGSEEEPVEPKAIEEPLSTTPEQEPKKEL